MFGDPKQHDHMMAGVKRAYGSPATPAHLRPHLAKRLGGTMAAFPPPRKTTVGGPTTERAPMKAVVTGTPRYSGTPQKTIVGSTARPPIKTTVGNLARPPMKTLVGSTAAPPMKTTPGNLGTGGKRPLGMAVADEGPINAANPVSGMNLPVSNGNNGRSTSPMPPPTPGPPNAALDWNKAWNVSGIEDGGMGPAAKSMGRAPSRGPRPVRRSSFYGE